MEERMSFYYPVETAVETLKESAELVGTVAGGIVVPIVAKGTEVYFKRTAEMRRRAGVRRAIAKAERQRMRRAKAYGVR